jgi:hypothetical protein
MKSQIEILQEIENARELTAFYLEKEPDADDLNWLYEELKRLAKLVTIDWPLRIEDKDSIHVGVFGARNLHELDNAKLSVILSRLDADLKM